LRPRASYPVTPAVELLTVPTVTLDGVIDHARPWRFGKLDLEGGEFRALQGAARSLESHRPLLVFESDRAGSAAAYGYGPDEFFGFFHALGYRLADLFGRPFAREGWESDAYPHYFIALHAASADHDRAERELPAILSRVLATATAA
jgi:Methyltransferase FkbM domain